jgi:hypothetical protein
LLRFAPVDDGTEPSVEAGTTVTDAIDDVVVVDEPASDERAITRRVRRVVVRAGRLRPAWKALAAYLLYQLLAFWIWVVPILPRFTQQHLGTGLQDSRQYQWWLSWTPWAIQHHLNPLHAHVLFAPTGVDLAWTAFIPGPAFVLWPISAVFGPLASLNLSLAAAPALAGWGAYLVCHRITRRFWASFVGGCMFGFSAYMAGNMLGFVNLVLIFPIPIMVYLVIRSVEGSLGPVAFVAGFTASLVGLFSISTEVFGTAAIFGAIAFLGAIAFGAGIRRELLRAGGLIAISAAISAIVLAPYIHDVVVNRPATAVRDTDTMAAGNAWSFLLPARLTFGGETVEPTVERLVENPVGDGLGYLGPAVLVVLLGFAVTERRRRSTWLLLAFVAVGSILVMGPQLHVGDRTLGRLPGDLLAKAPLVRSAVPARFALYVSLAVGVIVALWLSRASGRWAWARWVLGVAAAISWLPQAPVHAPPQQVPAFLASSTMHQVLQPGENVYAIVDEKGDEMLWQATADYWFDLAQGYIGPTGSLPPELRTGPISGGLHLRRVAILPPAQEFATWTRDHAVTAVVVDDRALSAYRSMLEDSGMTLVYSGEGVSVWRPAR